MPRTRPEAELFFQKPYKIIAYSESLKHIFSSVVGNHSPQPPRDKFVIADTDPRRFNRL